MAIGIGDLTLAYQCFKVAVSIDPAHVEAYNNLGVLEFRKGNDESARSYFKTGQRQAGHVFEVYYNTALLAFKQGDFQESFEQVGAGPGCLIGTIASLSITFFSLSEFDVLVPVSWSWVASFSTVHTIQRIFYSSQRSRGVSSFRALKCFLEWQRLCHRQIKGYMANTKLCNCTADIYTKSTKEICCTTHQIYVHSEAV